MRLFFLLAVSLLSKSLCAGDNSLYFPPGELIPARGHIIKIKGTQAVTNSQYDIDGAGVDLADTDSFTMLDVELHYIYGHSKTLELFGMGRYREITGEDSVTSYSTSGAESAYFGGAYMLGKWLGFKFNLRAHYGMTFNTNEEVLVTDVDQMVLGDSGEFFSLGIQGSRALSVHHFVGGGIFFDQPSGDYQSAYYRYFLETALRYRHWAFALGVRGHSSAGGDTYTGDEFNKPLINTHVTSNFNSINSSIMKAYASVKYKLGKKWSVGLEYTSTQSGQSIDNMTEVSGLFTYVIGGMSSERLKVHNFKDYELEAEIIKISPRGKFVKIDKGLASDVSKGMIFDIYKTDVFGGNSLIAKAVVREVSASWAVIKIIKKYSDLRIKKGFVARGN